MAQVLNTAFGQFYTPGAFPSVSVKNTTSGAAATGIVTIIGEADGGADYSAEDLKNNFFGPDQLDAVTQKYTSGHIVDAFRALSSPSNDANIPGSVTRIYISKTNTGTKAEATIDTDYGVLSAKNFGILGNQNRYKVSTVQAEIAPAIEGATIANFGAALDGVTFNIRLNGGAAAAVTLSGTPANHSNVATLVVELNSLLPAGIVAAAGAALNSIKLTVSADAAANRKGWGKAVELIETAVGDLALIGLLEGLTTSSAEPVVNTQVFNAASNVTESLLAQADVALTVGYQGTTATLTILNGVLTTTRAGGSGADLSITLSDYATIADLATYINTQTGYSASVVVSSSQLPPSALDNVSAIGICSTGAGLKSGRIKRALYNYEQALAQSIAVDFEADEVEGLPTAMSAFVFLSGGTKGGTSSANAVAAIDALDVIQTNFIVPLFSRDASADIVSGDTDPSSTYTIDAIHAAAKSHCLQMSTPKLKRNRLAVLSFKGSFSDAQSKSQSLASARCTLAFQDVFQINSQGAVIQFQPWYGACVAAGMQAAGFYKSITNKFANVISFTDPSGFDSGSPTDVDTMILSGLLGLQSDTAGNKWVIDQTTYGFDSNFVFNSMQAMYGADIVALDLADGFQKTFVGQSLADVSASSALAFLSSKMDQYFRVKLITGSDDAPAGFRNAKIRIQGPVMYVSVEIKLSVSLLFLPIEIAISEVSQSDGA